MKYFYEFSLSSRRDFIKTLAASTLSVSVSFPARASSSRTSRIICPFSAGGIGDRLARVVAEEASLLSDKNWIVQNMPGAGGLIAAAEVARSEPDGNTILLAPTGVFRTRRAKESAQLRVDPLRDLEALAIFGSMPLVCVSSGAKPYKTLASYLEQIRSENETFIYATAGYGSTSHVLGSYISQTAKVQSAHVGYTGSSHIAKDVLGGHLPFAILDLMPVYDLIASGSLNCLAISSNGRNKRLPNINTTIEQRLTLVEVTSWQGFVLPSGTRQTIKDSCIRLFDKISQTEALRATLESGFIEPLYLFGKEAQDYINTDSEFYKNIMQQLGITFAP